MAITKTDSGKLKNTDKVVTDIGVDNEPTTDSDNLVTSGGIKNALGTKADKSDTYTKQEVNDAIAAATPADYDTVKSQVQQNTQDISGIEAKIPAQASAQNQLADKEFVNSSIQTNAATFRGTYNLVSDLGLTVSATEEQTATAIATHLASLVPPVVSENNDYVFVQIPRETSDPTVVVRYDKYKCSVEEVGGVVTRTWAFEYSLNNSSFTADQWAAINSGITSGDVAKIQLIDTLVGRDYVVIDTSTMGVAARKSDDALTREFNNLDNVASTTYTQGAMSVIFRPRDLFVNTITNLGLPMTISNRALTTFSLSSLTLTMYVRDTGNPTKLVMSARRSVGDNSFVPVGTSDFVENITTGAIRNYTFTFHDFPASEAGDNYEFIITAKDANDTTVIPVIEFFGGGRYPVTDWSMRSAESPYSILSSGNQYALSMSMDATVYGEVEIPMARQSDITITIVKVNGSPLSPDGNKAVNVPVPIPATLDLPVIAGTPSVGLSDKFAREDHIHPAETEVVAYRLPDDCFPVTYAGANTSYSIASNDGLRFQDAAMGIEMYAYDASASGGYGDLLCFFDTTTLKYSHGNATGLKFNNTFPTANTWPVLEKDAVFVRKVRVAKPSDIPVTSVNSKTGAVTLDASDVGALPITGGTIRGDIELGEGGYSLSCDVDGCIKSPTGQYISFPSSGGILALLADTMRFSTAVSYAVGDVVFYNGAFYRCTTAHIGAWNASHFAEVLGLSTVVNNVVYPTAPTPTAGDNSTKVATTAFVKTAVDGATPNLDYVMRVNPETGEIYYTTPDANA